MARGPSTTCPRCDAPASAGARRCGRCGYEFLEDGATPLHRPRPSRGGAAAILAVCALAAGVVTAVAVIGGGGDEEATAEDGPPRPRTEVLSRHPLSTRGAERVLTELYLSNPDDDESDVRCSAREPRPAHSIRRCEILYPGGTDRTVVVVTGGNGSEVLSEP